ncbi:MAG: GNAT family N-acetyltransferase [Desulfobacterales bacterium]|nr:GNAT family N-acetyltransferase [Desulfobacterales bacterium]
MPWPSRRFYPWHHPRFLWQNRGYGDFEDYLASFSAGQRRNIRRERQAVADQQISVVPCAGEEAPLRYFERMYEFYLRTNAKFGPWGCRYLTEAFFDGLAKTCRRHLLFMAAHENGAGSDPVAMALLLAKGGGLWGRYWGADRSIHALHFEVCYYRPMAWAIEKGILRFDPGMGGDHKLRRGFAVSPAVSLHRFFDPRLQRVFALSMDEINRLEDQRMNAMNRMAPLSRQKWQNTFLEP